MTFWLVVVTSFCMWSALAHDIYSREIRELRLRVRFLEELQDKALGEIQDED